ncbi:MAG: hypothetical protein ACKVWV_11215 [Planctomycetota bacterium]
MNALRRIAVLSLLVGAGLCTAVARAQEPTPTPPPTDPQSGGEEAPIRMRPPPSAQDAAEQEMRELFLKVETRLREIDRLLSDAGAGDTRSLEKGLDSGMGELLKRTQESGSEALKDIDRILELAEQLDGRPGGGGGGKQQGEPQPQPGESPLDKQGGQSTQRESTPSKPEQGQQPNGEKQGQQQQDGQQDPRDGRASPEKDPRNTPGKAPPAGATDSATRRVDDQDRWGDLPVHARDIFRVEGGSDMPVQYRDWIDSYYRRLNTKKL